MLLCKQLLLFILKFDSILFGQLMEAKQLALEEMRTKSAAWPTKQNGWAESDVLDAVEAQEKRSENVLAAFATSVKKSEK